MGSFKRAQLTILAYLPTRLLRHLQFVVGSGRAPLIAQTWSEINDLLQVHPVSVAIIDPSGMAMELEQLTVAYPSLPVIAYVPLTTQSFTTITQLAQTGLQHVVLYSHDDDSPRFLSLIDQVKMSPLTVRVIYALRPKLTMLPLRLAKAVENLFEEPHRYPNAQDLATESTIRLVRVHRAFREVGLATPKKIFIAAKMLKAYSYLGDPAHSVNAVSKKLGYRHTRILSDHSNELFGLNPSRLHTYMTEDQVVEKILASIDVSPVAAAPGESGQGSSNASSGSV